MNENEPEVLNYLVDLDTLCKVAVVIKNPSIIEYEGDLVPGIAFTADAARQLANDLIVWAWKCDQLNRDDEGDDEGDGDDECDDE